MPRLLIPAHLRPLSEGAPTLEVDGCATVGAALRRIADRYAGLADRLLDDRGNLRRFVNVFVGEDNIRDLHGLETRVGPEDEIAIVLAVAGG